MAGGGDTEAVIAARFTPESRAPQHWTGRDWSRRLSGRITTTATVLLLC